MESYCNKCLRTTFHDLLHTQKCDDDWYDDGVTGFYEENTYDLLQCRGCHTVSIRHSSWDSSTPDGPNGEPLGEVRTYPPRTFRKPPRWLVRLELSGAIRDPAILSLLTETYVALQNDCPRLAAMGVRALIERVMLERIEDQGSFGKNLSKFHEGGFIASTQMDLLRLTIDAGHGSIHRGYCPRESDLNLLVDVAESLIESVFMTELRLGDFPKDIPARAGRRSK